MTNFSQELEQMMESRNFHIYGDINYSISGKFQRFSNNKKYHRKKDLFVILHDYDRGATFGDWHYPEDWYTHWNTAYAHPTLYQIKENEQQLKIKREVDDYERAKHQWRAREFFHKFYTSQYTDEHPYVIKKRIRAYYSRQVRSWLIIPVRGIDYNLLTLQIIKPDGFKRLWKGTSQKGNMIWLSEKLPENYNGPIRICEGYATGCSIYEAIGSPVICAINANNLVNVAIQLRKKFINASLKICADNDQWGKDNVGLKYGEEAYLKTGATLHYPDFSKFNTQSQPTDFNDLMCLAGIEAVENQLILIRK